MSHGHVTHCNQRLSHALSSSLFHFPFPRPRNSSPLTTHTCTTCSSWLFIFPGHTPPTTGQQNQAKHTSDPPPKRPSKRPHSPRPQPWPTTQTWQSAKPTPRPSGARARGRRRRGSSCCGRTKSLRGRCHNVSSKSRPSSSSSFNRASLKTTFAVPSRALLQPQRSSEHPMLRVLCLVTFCSCSAFIRVRACVRLVGCVHLGTPHVRCMCYSHTASCPPPPILTALFHLSVSSTLLSSQTQPRSNVPLLTLPVLPLLRPSLPTSLL
ncbi:hypothetical protein PTSG_00357 [Salpingoeca rosetta]|uniref:Uncharacterized protein n=1 Tax=Salpingoeca rosetta (strain ATCC 50818 / BSB-021) TaxID=946362 RepID=F2TW90_SALR5|nr:uncharacterized protein PTSG_00357 [Salpingoeca rosetta]EGD72336.1 hypothetical protein PTSG_00357 [Salpingoeca rosetta]|eukprot:XP_004998906.1 hypothetical protein PTSG_00357 [Salpingoeca rosetta]